MPRTATLATLPSPTPTRSGGRDLRFDSVRGALLLVMAVNHVGSDLSVVLDQPFGFVSAAEGFVFLSGILTGRLDHGAATAGNTLDRRARRRAWRAYFWHVIGLLGVWLWARGWMLAGQGRPWGLPYLFHEGSGLDGLASGLLLLYQPGLLDILPMYVGFPLLAPLVLRLHARGHGRAVWLGSGAIWALDQWLAPAHPIEWGVINTGAFHFLSWQWLFVTGVLLGAEPQWERRALRRPRPGLLVLAVAGALFLWLARRPELPHWWDPATLEALTAKTPLAALRLLNFGLLAYLLAVLGSRRPAWLVAPPLALLGRHSLPIFTASCWCAQIALSFPELGDTSTGRWLKTGFMLAGVLATAAACEVWRRHHARRTRPPEPARPHLRPGLSAVP